MPDAVVILGAGASADFGLQTLPYLFQDQASISYLRNNPDFARQLEEIFWEPRGYDRETSHRGVNIEEMLTLIRDWEEMDDPPQIVAETDLSTLRTQLYVLIYRAVYRGKSSRAAHLNDLIDFCREEFDNTIWASFNWDCIFEASFWYSSSPVPSPNRRGYLPYIPLDFPQWRREDRDHTLLKLHGAVNWWVIDGELTWCDWGDRQRLDELWGDFERGEMGETFPVILEPSFYKYEDEAPFEYLETMWNRFQSSLSNARYVIVIGYSLPVADERSVSVINTSVEQNPESEWLIVDTEQYVADRYERMIGEDWVSWFEGPLREFADDTVDNLHDKLPSLTDEDQEETSEDLPF